jgi:hypothetical protein
MGDVQLAALKEVVAFLRGKYPGIPFKRHRDMPGNATACPGTNYPFLRVTAAKPVPAPKPEPEPVPAPPAKPGWWTLTRRWLRLKKRH